MCGHEREKYTAEDIAVIHCFLVVDNINDARDDEHEELMEDLLDDDELGIHEAGDLYTYNLEL